MAAAPELIYIISPLICPSLFSKLHAIVPSVWNFMTVMGKFIPVLFLLTTFPPWRRPTACGAFKHYPFGHKLDVASPWSSSFLKTSVLRKLPGSKTLSFWFCQSQTISALWTSDLQFTKCPRWTCVNDLSWELLCKPWCCLVQCSLSHRWVSSDQFWPHFCSYAVSHYQLLSIFKESNYTGLVPSQEAKVKAKTYLKHRWHIFWDENRSLDTSHGLCHCQLLTRNVSLSPLTIYQVYIKQCVHDLVHGNEKH